VSDPQDLRFFLDASTPPNEALLLVSKHIRPLMRAIERDREASSLWAWNQLVSGIASYVREANDFLLQDADDDESDLTEYEILDWLEGGDGLDSLAHLDDFHARLNHILGHALDTNGNPFRGDAYAAILSSGGQILSFVEESDLEAEIEGQEWEAERAEQEPDREIRMLAQFYWFKELRVQDSSGKPIDKTVDENSWLEARKRGITASDANRLLKLNGEKRAGFWNILATKDADYVSPYFESFSLGIEREPHIAQLIIKNFPSHEFRPNNFLYENFSWEGHLATPDLVGKKTICEIKVGSKPLRQLYSRYRDQLQWQMHVLDCEFVLFVVEQRADQSLETRWVERDQERIDRLVEAAQELLEEM